MERRKYRDLAKQQNFLRLLAADAVSRFGDSLDMIAYSLIMFEITKSESLMALIIGLNHLPTVFLQPFMGAVIDRMPLKPVMVITDLCRFCLVATLAVMYSFGKMTPLGLALLTLLTSTVEAFRIPACAAFLPQTLKKEDYTIGKAAHFSLSRAMEMIGLIAAGGFTAAIGTVAVLWIDGATFLWSAAMIAVIPCKEAIKRTKISVRTVLRDFKEGLQYLKTAPAVQMIGCMGLMINFGLMPLSVFQTPYVYGSLRMGVEVLSLIKLLLIGGMMLGAMAAPKITLGSNRANASMAGVCMGLSIMLMFAVPRCTHDVVKIALLILSMLTVGLGGGVLNVLVGSCMMRHVPRDKMGRMSGLNAAVMQSSMPVGAFICSGLARYLALDTIFLMFGMTTAAMFLLFGFSKKAATL